MTLSEALLLKNGIELIEKDEIFKQVTHWNKYFISNYGRLVRENRNGNGYHIINPSITKGNYLEYTLSKPARTYKGKKGTQCRRKAKKKRMVNHCK